MKLYFKIFIALVILSRFFTYGAYAQSDPRLTYIFSNDSIAGFNETNTSLEALQHGCFGEEYKAFLYNQKRNFIKLKYNLKKIPAAPVTLFQNQLNLRTTAIGGACDNEDFELAGGVINAPGVIQGWTAQSGNNPNSCAPPALTGVGNYTVYNAPIVDAKLGFPVSSYFDAGTIAVPAGNCFVKLNDAAAGNKAVKLTKTFIVGSGNALFQYAYLPVISSAPHPCCEQPGFNIRVTVTNTTNSTFTILACPQISVAVPGTACFYTPAPGAPVFSVTPGDANWVYHNWAASTIDLTPYIGMQVTLDIVVVDCIFTAHGGYAYFDAKCAPMAIVGNNTPFPAGTPSITLPTCGANSATICAPNGIGPYTWAGPNVVAPYNTPLVSNQCLTVGVSADFSLTMNPPGSCNPIVRVITVTITPAPYILASILPASCGATNAVVSWTAAGSASVNPTIIWNPIPTSTAISAVNLGTATFPTGTGVVTVTALDPLGCRATATVNILPTPPTPTVMIQNVTGSQSITCNTPTVDLNAVSGYTAPLNYYWASNTFTSGLQQITVVSAATLITLTVTDPATGCSSSATTSVKVNTTVPVSSVAPINQFINCGPAVVATATGVAISPTINVSHQWFGPDGTPGPITGGALSIYNPYIVGSVGINTFVLTDLINGCSSSKTVQVISTGGEFPTFTLTSLANFTLGCGTRSVGDINIVGANTNPPPGGGVVSYTMLPPGFTGTNYTTSVTVPSYTVNSPGNYILIVRDNGNQCETRVLRPIIQNTFTPNITASVATNTLDCITTSVVLQGNSTTPNVLYTWKKNTLPPLVTNSVLPVSTTTAGASVPSSTLIDTYTLTIEDKGNTCFSNTTVTVYQNTRPPKPGIAFSFTALTCAVYSVNATNNSTTGVLPGTFFGTKGLRAILWQGPSPQKDLMNNSTYLCFTAGIYTMTVMDLDNGCTSQTTAVLGDNRVYPVITSTPNAVLDCGAGSGGAKLTASVIGLTAAQVTSHWDVPPTAITSTVDALNLTTDAIGEYVLTVTTKTNGCASKAFVNVTNGVLTANFTADRETGYAPLTVNFTNGSRSSLEATATQSITSIWSYGNGTTKTTTVNTTQANTAAVYAQPGTYTVTMYAIKGSCVDTFYKVIRIDIPSKLEVPNVFTPNGDNSNDIFFVKTANLSEITAMIFDRWGTKVYELATNKGNIAWDGKNLAAKEVPDGTYFYVITANGKDGQTYDIKGTVSLFR